jgi:hypothetical protein
MRASTVTADDPVVKVPEEVKVCILKPPAVVTVPPVGRPILNCVVVAGLRHKAVDPVIAGGALLTVTAKVLTMLFPQLPTAVTLMFPLLAPTVVVMEVVVEVPVQPDGKVQMYEVAPLTAEIL